MLGLSNSIVIICATLYLYLGVSVNSKSPATNSPGIGHNSIGPSHMQCSVGSRILQGGGGVAYLK